MAEVEMGGPEIQTWEGWEGISWEAGGGEEGPG